MTLIKLDCDYIQLDLLIIKSYLIDFSPEYEYIKPRPFYWQLTGACRHDHNFAGNHPQPVGGAGAQGNPSNDHWSPELPPTEHGAQQSPDLCLGQELWGGLHWTSNCNTAEKVRIWHLQGKTFIWVFIISNHVWTSWTKELLCIVFLITTNTNCLKNLLLAWLRLHAW